jgi:hypothetical protein
MHESVFGEKDDSVEILGVHADPPKDKEHPHMARIPIEKVPTGSKNVDVSVQRGGKTLKLTLEIENGGPNAIGKVPTACAWRCGQKPIRTRRGSFNSLEKPDESFEDPSGNEFATHLIDGVSAPKIEIDAPQATAVQDVLRRLGQQRLHRHCRSRHWCLGRSHDQIMLTLC